MSESGKRSAALRLAWSGAIVFSASGIDMLAQLLRNAIFARLLSVPDFGIVATFSILLTLMDAALSSGVDQMAVQARDADDPKLQGSLHAIQLVLGAITALLLLAIAWPYSYAIGTPGLGWAYASLALVPLIRGLGHLDSLRLQRQGRYLPSMLRQTVPPIVALITIWPAYLLFGDFRLALLTIYAQQLALLLATHLGARQPYRLRYDRENFRRAFAFGWPLMANALLLYVVFNGDRIIVSNRFGLQTLGWFSAGVMLTLLPINFVAKSFQSLLLPVLARHQDDLPRLQRLYDQMVSLFAIVAAGFVIGTALAGREVITFVFGHKFEPALPYLLLLALMQGLRLIRIAASLAAMSRAETKNPLIANIYRVLFVALSLAVAVVTNSIYAMLAAGIAGEVVAGVAAAGQASRSSGFAVRHSIMTTLAMAVLGGAVAAISLMGWPLWIALLPCAFFAWVVRDLVMNARGLLN
ncbi:MAG: hypothetical protein A4S16_10860 [Proteobacteria bacterium SG_bin6]|nr:MAG: hypothetical protein A4S16_10860 [Proteobacteria bacterium SG_bin6]